MFIYRSLTLLNSRKRRVTRTLDDADDRRKRDQGARVRDFGPGAPEEALVDMFRPFYRAVPNDADGVGLGLAIAQRAVRGTIRARNVHPGLEVAITVPDLECFQVRQ